MPKEEQARSPAPTAPKTAADRTTTAGRMVTVIAALGATFGLLWLVLPMARATMLPAPSPGGWVLGPDVALRFGACAVIAACTLPFVLRPLGRRWRERDLAARGAPIDPLASSPFLRTKTLIQGFLLLVIYLFSGAFYFTSYTEILDHRFVVHSPLGAHSYGYDQVEALELQAPVGGQPERYALHFDDDRWAYFSTAAEGTTDDEVAGIAAHVAARTGLEWAPTNRR